MGVGWTVLPPPTNMKAYDTIKQLLEKHPHTRNSDKALAFNVWNKQGYIKNRAITFEDFKKALSFETIRRTRQKIQEKHPLLRPTDKKVIKARRQKQETKGTFIYQEKLV